MATKAKTKALKPTTRRAATTTRARSGATAATSSDSDQDQPNAGGASGSFSPAQDVGSSQGADAPASPFVEDGGVIGMPAFTLSGPITTSADVQPTVVTPLSKEDLMEEAPTAAAAAPEPAPAPERTAPEMKLPRSFEDEMMDDMGGDFSDAEAPVEEAPAGNIGPGTSDSIASSTAKMILSTLGMLSNNVIVEISNINEEEIEEAVKDGQMPSDVLADVQELNKRNAKDKPFKKEYADMIEPHLKRFCAVQGVENLSPTTMLIVVCVIVAVMMFMDTRKRLVDRARFMKRLLEKYGRPAEVVESTIKRA